MSFDDHDPSAAAPTAQSALGTVVRWLGEILPEEPSDDARAAIDELIPDGGSEARDFLLRFCSLIVLSASIAAFGLLSDSGAVVIGAMLVAPLMTPIMAAAAATVSAQNRRLVRALVVIAIGTVLAILTGFVVSLIAGGSVIDVRALPQEIRSRTFPGLLDLGVAITAGAAAGYVQPRRSAFSALPGVGIAVALVPPLATVGITFELGLRSEASGALLLFLTNLAAIIFAAGLMLLLAGFRPHATSNRGTLLRRISLTTLAVVLVAVPLFQHTRSALQDARLQSAVVRAVEAWDGNTRIVEITSDVAGGRATVALLLAGPGEPQPTWKLAESIRDRFGGPVDLRVLYQSDVLHEVTAR